MPKNMFCENLVSPRMCLRKSWISRTVVCERSGSDLSQKIFLPMFCEKPPCPKICFAKIWFPQGCVCENPGYPGPWFAKDQGQIFLKRFAIVKLFVATCAHILINEENNIFLRNVGFEFHSLSSLFFMNSLRKNNMSRILFCENPASQRMCLRKSWGIRTLVCERSGSGLSQKMFHVCMSY